MDAQKLSSDLQTCVMENMMGGKTSDQTYQELLDLCGQDMRKANRLIRTETSYAANQAEKYACEEAGLERYLFIAGLEARTCAVCGKLDDGKPRAYKDAVPGRNYPPMHPHCRCTTRPYDEDIEAILTDKDTRWARDPETGKTYEVPMKMTYEEWLKKQQEVSGIDSVDVARKKLYNRTADKKQLEAYQARLGKQNAPKTLDDFQKIKYNKLDEYETLKRGYATIGEVEVKEWSNDFKEKAKKAYFSFKEQGVEVSAHGLSRLCSSRISDTYTPEDVIKICRKPANYLQPDGREIRYYDRLAAVKSAQTPEIVTFVSRPSAQKEWKKNR